MRKTYLPVLVAIALLLAGLALVAAPAATVYGQPATPRADGSIVHIVQPGESLWGIAIQYSSILGMSAEDALPYLQELNNNPAFINPGDEIIIREGEVATATPEATVEPTVDPAATAEATPAVGGGTPPGEIPSTDLQPTEAPAGTICVAAFDDANADGQRNEGEALVANAAIALSRAGTTTSTYITDGISEPFCFELTEADSYQLQLFPPAGFTSTTEDTWSVAIANGESYTVSFGLTAAAAATATTAVDSAETPAATDATASANGGFGNLGLIVAVVAVVLVVLAAIGVVLLRRG